MGLFGKKPNASTSTSGLWDDELEELPRAGTKDAKWVGRRSRIFRWWLWASILLFPIGMIAAVGAQTAARNARDTADELSAVRTEQAASKAVATAAVEDWLSSTPPPVPGGKILTWEGATVSEVPVDEQASNAEEVSGVTIELNSFVVADRSGAQYRVEVPVAVDERGGSVVTAVPSLIPLSGPIADDWSTLDVWPGLSETRLGEDALAVLDSWVAAYTSGDPRALRLAVGDDNGDHQYQPLTGVHYSDIEPVAAATVSEDDPSILVVRVRVGVVWEREDGKYTDSDGEPLDLDGDTPVGISNVANFELDLLVERADTASPVVVAWGGPGSGPLLERYANAVSGERAEPDAYLPGRSAPDDDTVEGDGNGDDDKKPSDDEDGKKSTTTTAPKKPSPTTTKAPAKDTDAARNAEKGDG